MHFFSIFVKQTIDNLVTIFCTFVVTLAEGVFIYKKVNNNDNNNKRNLISQTKL